MSFFLKYIVTLFYKKLRIKIVLCLLRESGRAPDICILVDMCGVSYSAR